MSERETTRLDAYLYASDWLLGCPRVSDFAFLVAKGAARLRGESRVGYAIGVLNALETLSYREND